MLRPPTGKPAAAIVTIAHLADEERQFVVALLLSKVVTWMRKQSGTTDLRTLVYMDEVMGYVPPSANPPTKQPIMTLMKQARAFGVGLVLSTQNPVDVDYKAISNAGTWMVGRLQTERDKARLLDGMSAAGGGVDVKAINDTISGLAKREFVLHRSGKDAPEVFTSRWAMSYLRGPLTRDQIDTLTSPPRQAAARAVAPAMATPAAAPATAASGAEAAPAPVASAADDATSLMPEVAQGVSARWVDGAAAWLASVGGRSGGKRYAAAAVARIHLRYDEEKADLVVNEEYEAVLHPLTAEADPTLAVTVDYDDRNLLTVAPSGSSFVLPDAPIKSKTFWTNLEKDLVAHLARSRTVEIFANRPLKLYSRAGESQDEFVARCKEEATTRADEEAAKLRDKYETKATSLQNQLQAAQDRASVLATEAKGRQRDSILSAASGILGSFLGGRLNTRRITSGMRSAAGSHSRSQTTSQRLEAAQNKAGTIEDQLAALEAELTDDITHITEAWDTKAAAVESVPVGLEKTDVQVAQLVLAWVPVA
jgi:hypothetical protein